MFIISNISFVLLFMFCNNNTKMNVKTYNFGSSFLTVACLTHLIKRYHFCWWFLLIIFANLYNCTVSVRKRSSTICYTCVIYSRPHDSFSIVRKWIIDVILYNIDLPVSVGDSARQLLYILCLDSMGNWRKLTRCYCRILLLITDLTI